MKTPLPVWPTPHLTQKSPRLFQWSKSLWCTSSILWKTSPLCCVWQFTQSYTIWKTLSGGSIAMTRTCCSCFLTTWRRTMQGDHHLTFHLHCTWSTPSFVTGSPNNYHNELSRIKVGTIKFFCDLPHSYRDKGNSKKRWVMKMRGLDGFSVAVGSRPNDVFLPLIQL